MQRSWAVGVMMTCSMTAQASPQEVLGFGYRSLGMGTTGAAVAEDADAVYGNPALLSVSRHITIQLGLTGAAFDLHARGPDHPGQLAYSSLKASNLGVVLPLPFGGVLRDRIALGLGFTSPLDLVVRGRILYVEKPQFLIADRVQTIALQGALSVDVGWGVRVGGGFMALAALTGSVLVATDASGRIGTTVEDTLVASYTPVIGASYDIGDRYRVGLTFRGEQIGRFNVVIVAEDLGALDIPPLNISGVAQYDPWQIAVEVARVKGPWRAAVGVTYKHWSAYPGPTEATVRCEDSPDPELDCNVPLPPDPDYSPTVSPRVGVERRMVLGSATSMSVRVGYAFEPSPAPEQKGRTSWYDNHRSILSAGYGFRLGDVGFDGFMQVQVLHPRSHEKRVSEGAAIDTTVETHGFIGAGGVAVSVRF